MTVKRLRDLLWARGSRYCNRDQNFRCDQQPDFTLKQIRRTSERIEAIGAQVSSLVTQQIGDFAGTEGKRRRRSDVQSGENLPKITHLVRDGVRLVEWLQGVLDEPSSESLHNVDPRCCQ